jgi:hypothetical protein
MLLTLLDRSSLSLGVREVFTIHRKTTLIGDIRRAEIGIYGKSSRIP